MHIAIEGIDGVGKTTIATELAKRINFEFIEKPLHYLFDDEGDFPNYIRIRDGVNKNPNKKYTAWFYGLGNIYLYERFKDKNIITDRHILSNYSWSGEKETNYIFNAIIRTIGLPNYTFILYADEYILKQRLLKRNMNDSDLLKTQYNAKVLNKMNLLVHKHKMPHLIIDTSKLSVEETLNLIITTLVKKGLIVL